MAPIGGAASVPGEPRPRVGQLLLSGFQLELVALDLALVVGDEREHSLLREVLVVLLPARRRRIAGGGSGGPGRGAVGRGGVAGPASSYSSLGLFIGGASPAIAPAPAEGARGWGGRVHALGGGRRRWGLSGLGPLGMGVFGDGERRGWGCWGWGLPGVGVTGVGARRGWGSPGEEAGRQRGGEEASQWRGGEEAAQRRAGRRPAGGAVVRRSGGDGHGVRRIRSEEHTSELQSR